MKLGGLSVPYTIGKRTWCFHYGRDGRNTTTLCVSLSSSVSSLKKRRLWSGRATDGSDFEVQGNVLLRVGRRRRKGLTKRERPRRRRKVR